MPQLMSTGQGIETQAKIFPLNLNHACSDVLIIFPDSYYLL